MVQVDSALLPLWMLYISSLSHFDLAIVLVEDLLHIMPSCLSSFLFGILYSHFSFGHSSYVFRLLPVILGIAGALYQIKLLINLWYFWSKYEKMLLAAVPSYPLDTIFNFLNWYCWEVCYLHWRRSLYRIHFMELLSMLSHFASAIWPKVRVASLGYCQPKVSFYLIFYLNRMSKKLSKQLKLYPWKWLKWISRPSKGSSWSFLWTFEEPRC